MNRLTKLNEARIFFALASILVSIYLVQITWSTISIFVDIFLVIAMSWLLSFVLEPIVKYLLRFNLTRIQAAIIVYIFLAILLLVIGLLVVPMVVAQLSQLSSIIPSLFTNAPLWANKVSEFLSNMLANSVIFVQSLASTVLGFLMVLIVSFSFITEREQISSLILKILPDSWENEYKFLEKTINTSFAVFLQVQLVNGLIFFVATFFVLWFLKIPYALSVGVFAGILAAVPVIGPVISLIPPILSALLVTPQTGLIAVVTLFLIEQIIYNVVSPRLLGQALKIHPIIVLFSFVIGYKLAGAWGALFAVPVVSSATVVLKEFLSTWQKES